MIYPPIMEDVLLREKRTSCSESSKYDWISWLIIPIKIVLLAKLQKIIFYLPIFIFFLSFFSLYCGIFENYSIIQALGVLQKDGISQKQEVAAKHLKVDVVHSLVVGEEIPSHPLVLLFQKCPQVVRLSFSLLLYYFILFTQL